MRVKKRNGYTEHFDMDKVKKGIMNSAFDVSFIITSTDLDIVANDVRKKLIELRGMDGETTVYEVRGLIYYILIDYGFSIVAKSYMNINLRK